MNQIDLHSVTRPQPLNVSSCLETASESRVGPVREKNQDAFISVIGPNGQADLWMIADGMGGYQYGEIASRLAIQTLLDVVQHSAEPIHQAFRIGFETANLSVLQKAIELRGGPIGTTLTAVYLSDSMLTLAHVGDSRVYLLRQGKVNCLTRDHSVVGELVRMRVLDEESVRSHAQRSILTRAIGLSPIISADISRIEVREGDRILLCTDGLWSVVSDYEIQLAGTCSGSVSEWVSSLLDLAEKRCTDDNLTAIGVHIRQLSEKVPSRRISDWNWLRAFIR